MSKNDSKEQNQKQGSKQQIDSANRTKNQPGTESSTKSNTREKEVKDASRPKARSPVGTKSDIFEDIDLNDPKDEPEDPDYEMIEHGEATHSSYNSQADHAWKYSEESGKGKHGKGKQGKGSGK